MFNYLSEINTFNKLYYSLWHDMVNLRCAESAVKPQPTNQPQSNRVLMPWFLVADGELLARDSSVAMNSR